MNCDPRASIVSIFFFYLMILFGMPAMPSTICAPVAKRPLQVNILLLLEMHSHVCPKGGSIGQTTILLGGMARHSYTCPPGRSIVLPNNVLGDDSIGFQGLNIMWQ